MTATKKQPRWQVMRHRSVYEEDGTRKVEKQIATDANGQAIEFGSEDKAHSAVGVYNRTDPVWRYQVHRKDD